jgi:hypothetical protein
MSYYKNNSKDSVFINLSSNNLINLDSINLEDWVYLKIFDVRNNLLTELPQLPEGIAEIFCHLNKLTQLPSLPQTLVTLTCSHNPLIKIPQLPNGLTTLEVVQTPFKEFQNIPTGLRRIYLSTNHMQSYLEKFSNTKTSIIIIN